MSGQRGFRKNNKKCFGVQQGIQDDNDNPYSMSFVGGGWEAENLAIRKKANHPVC
jgi:hypothetical protein